MCDHGSMLSLSTERNQQQFCDLTGAAENLLRHGCDMAAGVLVVVSICYVAASQSRQYVMQACLRALRTHPLP